MGFLKILIYKTPSAHRYYFITHNRHNLESSYKHLSPRQTIKPNKHQIYKYNYHNIYQDHTQLFFSLFRFFLNIKFSNN